MGVPLPLVATRWPFAWPASRSYALKEFTLIGNEISAM
jgi:hypothetical protein